MQISKVLILLGATTALTACGGGGGGGGGGFGGGTPGASLGEVFRAEPTGSLLEDPFAVDQAMRGNPEFTASNTQGATGVIAMGTFLGGAPVLRDVRMSLNEDRSILTIQIQGQGTVQLAADDEPNNVFGSWGEFFDGKYVSLSHFDDMGDITYSDTSNIMNSVNGSGVYGLETPIDRLPDTSDPVFYAGTFETIAYVSSFSAPPGAATVGSFSMALTFDAGAITGTTSGSIFYFNGETLAEDEGATGTLTGTISGNGIGGTFTLVGDNSSASHTYEGNLFGWDGEDMGGGVIATITAAGNSGYAYGSFEGGLD